MHSLDSVWEHGNERRRTRGGLRMNLLTICFLLHRLPWSQGAQLCQPDVSMPLTAAKPGHAKLYILEGVDGLIEIEINPHVVKWQDDTLEVKWLFELNEQLISRAWTSPLFSCVCGTINWIIRSLINQRSNSWIQKVTSGQRWLIVGKLLKMPYAQFVQIQYQFIPNLSSATPANKQLQLPWIFTDGEMVC